MKKRLFLFIVPLLYFGFVNAQMVQTTHGTTIQSTIPFSTFHAYSYTQHIVLKSELESGGWNSTYDSITKLCWHREWNTSLSSATHWKIYLGNTSKTVFSSATDWVALADLTEVFDGDIFVPTSGGWIEVRLDQPFGYNGVDNLVIAVNEVTEGWSSSVYFTSTDVGTNRGLSTNQGNPIPNPVNPFPGLLVSTLPSVQIYFRESCPQPNNVHLLSVSSSTATIAWGSDNEVTDWVVEYGVPGFTTGTVVQASTNPFTLTGLNPATAYEVRVRAMCDVSDSSMWSFRAGFGTPCATCTLPYSENFTTSPLPYCWTQTYSGGSSVGVWYHSPNGHQAGGSAGEMVGGGGGMDPAVSRLISPLIRFDNVAVATLSFKHLYSINIPGTLIKVQCSPDLLTWTDLPFSHTGGYIAPTTQTFQFAPLADSLYFAWVIDGEHSYIDAWYLDNVSIIGTSGCVPPIGISYSNVTTTTVDIGWASSLTGNTWEIEYGETGFVQGTGTILPLTTHSVTLTGLTGSTCYDFYVRTICASGETSNWSLKQTFCTVQIPVDVPFTIDFETPSGFTFANNPSGSNWYIGKAAGVNNTPGGSNGLYISIDNGVTNSYGGSSAVVWAFKDIYFTPSTSDYVLSFDWKSNGEVYLNTYYDYFNVYIGNPVMPVANCTGIVNPPNYTATALATIMGAQTSWQSESYILPAADYSGQTKRLYFCWKNDYYTVRQPPAAIDNITAIQSCLLPTDLQVTNITDRSATATWTAGGTETSWQVAYKLVSATNWTTVTVDTNSHTMTGLQSGSHYHVRVKAICSSGESWFTTPIPFATVVIDENELSKYVTLYPNPTQYLIDLKIDRGFLGATECRIYDMYGRLMRVLSIEEEITTIDVSHFASGVYLVRLTTEQGQISKRFVKQ